MAQLRNRVAPFTALAAIVALMLGSCSNAFDFKAALDDEYKAANGLYLEIASFSPSSGASGVSPSEDVLIVFDREIDIDSIGPESLRIVPSLDYTASFNSETLTLKVDAAFNPLVSYTVTATTSLQAMDGSSLRRELSWSFTTRQGPSGTVQINKDAEYCASRLVSLALNVNNEVSRVRFSQTESGFTDSLIWQALSDSYSFELSEGTADGQVRVYAQFINSDNSLISSLVSDDIILDTQAPTVDAGSNLVWNSATKSLSLNPSVSDALSSEGLSYKWSVEHKPEGAELGFDDSILAKAKISDLSGEGSYDIRLSVSDGAGNSASDSLGIFCDTLPPSVEAGYDLSLNNLKNAKNLSGNASDANGIASYSWTYVQTDGSANSLIIDKPGDKDTGISVPTNSLATYTLSLKAVDAFGNEASDDLTVRRTTDSIDVDAGENLIWNLSSTSLSPSPTISGTTTETLAYKWSVQSGPAGGVGFDNDELEKPGISVTTDGLYVLKLSLTVNGLTTYSDYLNLTVDRVAPSLSINVSNPYFNSSLSPNVSVIEETSGIGSYSWVKFSGTGDLSFSDATIASPAISASADGTYVLRLTVTDQAGNSSTAQKTLYRDATPPTVEAGAGQLIWNASSSSLSTLASVSDANIHGYAWTYTSLLGGNPHFSDPSALNPSLSPDEDDSYVLTLTAIDAAGNSTSDSVSLLKDTVIPASPTISGTTPSFDTTPRWSWLSGGGGNGVFEYQLASTSGAWTATSSLYWAPTEALEDGSSYRLYLREMDDAGNYSATVSTSIYVTICQPTPNARNVDIRPTLSWRSAARNASYKVQIYINKAWVTLVTGTKSTSYTLSTSLVTGTSYDWKVFATVDLDTSLYFTSSFTTGTK